MNHTKIVKRFEYLIFFRKFFERFFAWENVMRILKSASNAIQSLRDKKLPKNRHVKNRQQFKLLPDVQYV